jgi:multidrug resistance efflux pump
MDVATGFTHTERRAVSTLDGVAPVDMEDSLEALLGSHPTSARTVHLLTLAIVLAGAIGIGHASVDVTVRAPGTIRPLMERQTLRAMVDGVVARVSAARDAPVRAGDTLLVLESAPTDRAKEATEAALHDQRKLAHDLALMAGMEWHEDSFGARSLILPRSRAGMREAQVEWRQLSIAVTQAARARDRTRQLAARGFAMPIELERAELELTQATDMRALALERRRAAWTVERAGAEQRKIELERDLAREVDAHEAHVLVAPASGTIEELAAATPGSAVRAGDPIATISPDAGLVAELLVSSRDIGRIRREMKVRLLVEGYDVQEWGALSGTVISVARDFVVADGAQLFRVRARLESDRLRRPDGRTAVVSRGLRCQARFLVGRRRLTDLLLHRAREWADPSVPSPSGRR